MKCNWRTCRCSATTLFACRRNGLGVYFVQGQFLETLTWPEAEQALKSMPVVLLPVGARAKEHGLHLPLNTDWLLAEYLTERVLREFPALALPTVPYGYYPAFVEYPGSTHVEREPFQATIRDICRWLGCHGARRLYVLNTGISTNWALEPARVWLQEQGIVMEYTDLRVLLPEISRPLEKQPAGTHADEIETSMMLYVHPDVVRMDRARRDIDPRRRRGRLTRNPDADDGVYSPTGAWGDPTLATAEKGRIVIESLVNRILSFLQGFVQDTYQPEAPREEYRQ